MFDVTQKINRILKNELDKWDGVKMKEVKTKRDLSTLEMFLSVYFTDEAERTIEIYDRIHKILFGSPPNRKNQFFEDFNKNVAGDLKVQSVRSNYGSREFEYKLYFYTMDVDEQAVLLSQATDYIYRIFDLVPEALTIKIKFVEDSLPQFDVYDWDKVCDKYFVHTIKIPKKWEVKLERRK